MKKLLVCFCLVAAFSFCLAQVARASSETDALLKLLVKKGVVSEQEAAGFKAEVVKEAEVNPQPVAVTSGMPIKSITLSGSAEFDYNDPDRKANSFYAEFDPTIDVAINDNMSFKTMLGFPADSASSFYIMDLWLKYKDIPNIGGEVRAGKMRRNTFGLYQGSRMSIGYSLLARAFTSQRQTGIEYTRAFKDVGLLGPVNIGLGVFNGGSVTSYNPGDPKDSDVYFVGESTKHTDDDQNKEVAFRTTIEPAKGLKLGGSALVGQLSATDLTTLNTALVTAYTDDKKQRVGGDISYTFSNIPLELRAEYIQGYTSDYRQDAWSVMAISKDIIKGKLDLFSIYSQLTPDIVRTSSTYTWRLHQLTTGLIWHFNKNAFLQVDYEMTEEDVDVGVAQPENKIVRSKVEFDF